MTTSTNRRRQAEAERGTTVPLREKVILLVLSLTAPGNHRAIRDKSILVTDADKRRLSTVKRLIDAPEHRAVGHFDMQIRSTVSRWALPSPFSKGTHAIPIQLLQEVEGYLEQALTERGELIAKLAAAYDRIKEESRLKLAGVYRESDYLDADQLAEAYTMTWQYISLTAPDQLAAIDGGLFRREQERLERQWNSAIDEMRDALRVGLNELITDMVGRLQRVDDDKRFKPSKLLQRFDDFLETFEARNVTNDAALAELAQKARRVLKGVSTERLIESSDLRGVIKKEFTAVQTALVKLETESASRRRIRLTDDE